MEILTKKSQVIPRLEPVIKLLAAHHFEEAVNSLHEQILSQKIKFPLLEFVGHELFYHLDLSEVERVTRSIQKFKTIGGHVITGTLLQSMLEVKYALAINLATEYISEAESWHICDIIGERVFGNALVQHPTKTIPLIAEKFNHPNQWVVRSLGAGIHLSIKRGLQPKFVEELFKLLLKKANDKNKEVKQGVGWAAKTTAKFHPLLIEKYKEEIENKEKVGPWFRTKVKIGLDRNSYVQRKRS